MRYIYILIFLGFVSFPGKAAINSQSELADFAKGAELWFAVESNLLAEPSTFSGSISLINNSAQALPAGNADWQIYLHMVRRINSTEQAGLTLQHIQGDLHRISPTKNFKGLAVGETLQLNFQSAPWIISYSDFMPRAFIVAAGLTPEIFANTDTEEFSHFVRPMTEPRQLLRNIGNGDKFATMTDQQRYRQNQTADNALLSNAELQRRIVPSPAKLQMFDGNIALSSKWQLHLSAELQHEGRYLQQQLQQYFGSDITFAQTPGKQQIKLKLAAPHPSLAAESYQLKIRGNVVEITGTDKAGVFYGIQSLLALLPVRDQATTPVRLPQLFISDQPRYRWRGMHYDMGRNFHGIEVTLRLIEQMARYKLNRLHLHLTEDEGWRLEIPGLPELTELGAYRCFDLTEQHCLLTQLGTGPHPSGSGNGYYSREQFIQLLRHAQAHHIQVIPEIDLPGHARAAIKAMESRYQRLNQAEQPEQAAQYRLTEDHDLSDYLTVQNYNDNSVNVCLESSYQFVDKVISELQQMYLDAGTELTLFHMGGDEVAKGSWQGSPACQQLIAKPDNGINSVDDLKPYFINRVAQLTAKRGLALAAWEDGLMATAAQPFARKQFQNPQVVVNAWDNIWEWGYGDRAYLFANAGYNVVQSPGTNLYFDHPQEAHPAERGYYWAARSTDTEKVFFYRPDHLYHNAEFTRDGTEITDLAALLGRELPQLEKPENMLGIQGQVWSETIRTAAQLEQMVYPRLIALAERAWHKAGWEPDKTSMAARADWQHFSQRLVSHELPRLQLTNSGHYLPPPGAIRDNGKLMANVAWPGLIIEYSVDQGQSWQHFQQPLTASAKQIWLRSKLGGVTSRIIKL
ncbi:family 20 glycosylhydrolase [Arsukibacterium indicum]|uniref:beta-N-acetylhexosaminidase n=1 Tax=Arsukibacterium indicum TaxID=2848612 RepID=A0ABS6MMU2_9GAMM|nr:family 20 glycosylhydrolase [Arsukibacterium indicum]MBV2130132.1 carbohydate-binding domain-containing protein [Arsukibacterium indicum]